MAQPLPIQSWKRMFPCVVSAAKSGAESLMRSDMENSSLKVLVEGRNPEHHTRSAHFIMSRLSDFPAPFPIGETVGGLEPPGRAPTNPVECWTAQRPVPVSADK